MALCTTVTICHVCFHKSLSCMWLKMLKHPPCTSRKRLNKIGYSKTLFNFSFPISFDTPTTPGRCYLYLTSMPINGKYSPTQHRFTPFAVSRSVAAPHTGSTCWHTHPPLVCLISETEELLRDTFHLHTSPALHPVHRQHFNGQTAQKTTRGHKCHASHHVHSQMNQLP